MNDPLNQPRVDEPRTGVMPSAGLKDWDVAAGILLVREAGGFVPDFRGGDRPRERNEYLAANDAIHSRLHKLVAGALR